MRVLLLIATLVIADAAPSAAPTGGTIDGKVIRVENNKQVAPKDVFVYLVPVKRHRHTPKSASPKTTIKQVKPPGAAPRFEPSIMVVPTGTEIHFPNEDTQEHNVFSPDPYFDLGRYGAKESKPHVFDTPGEIDIYCDIHQCMEAHVRVVDVPGLNYIATVDATSGTYTFTSVPDGVYQVYAWSSHSTPVPSDVITVSGGGAYHATELHLQIGPAKAHRRKDDSTYKIAGPGCDPY